MLGKAVCTNSREDNILCHRQTCWNDLQGAKGCSWKKGKRQNCNSVYVHSACGCLYFRQKVLYLSWFSPRQQFKHYVATCSLPHKQDQGENQIGKAKIRKLTSWEKDSLVEEAKAKQNKELIQFPLSREVFSNLQESKYHHFKFLPVSSFLVLPSSPLYTLSIA